MKSLMSDMREKVARLIAECACMTDVWQDYLPMAEAILSPFAEERRELEADARSWEQQCDDARTLALQQADRAEKAEASRDALREYCSHEIPCPLAQWSQGRPIKDGGYETMYAGKWYQGDDKPECTCGLDAILAGAAPSREESGGNHGACMCSWEGERVLWFNDSCPVHNATQKEEPK